MKKEYNIVYKNNKVLKSKEFIKLLEGRITTIYPEFINENTVKRLAFAYCTHIKEFIMPENMTSINERAFEGCSRLETVVLEGDSFRSISVQSFYNCKSLRNVTISKSIISIRDFAFAECVSLENINYTGTIEEWNSLVSLGYRWNYNSSIKTITCSNGTVSI